MSLGVAYFILSYNEVYSDDAEWTVKYLGAVSDIKVCSGFSIVNIFKRKGA